MTYVRAPFGDAALREPPCLLDHLRKDCQKAEAIHTHRYSKCGKAGHLEKFCRGEGSDGRSQLSSKNSVKVAQMTENAMKSSSNKSARTQKVLKEVLTRLVTLNEGEGD